MTPLPRSLTGVEQEPSGATSPRNDSNSQLLEKPGEKSEAVSPVVSDSAAEAGEPLPQTKSAEGHCTPAQTEPAEAREPLAEKGSEASSSSKKAPASVQSDEVAALKEALALAKSQHELAMKAQELEKQRLWDSLHKQTESLKLLQAQHASLQESIASHDPQERGSNSKLREQLAERDATIFELEKQVARETRPAEKVAFDEAGRVRKLTDLQSEFERLDALGQARRDQEAVTRTMTEAKKPVSAVQNPALASEARQRIFDEAVDVGFYQAARAHAYSFVASGKVKDEDGRVAEVLPEGAWIKNPQDNRHPFQRGQVMGYKATWAFLCDTYCKREWDERESKIQWTRESLNAPLYESAIPANSYWKGFGIGVKKAKEDFRARAVPNEKGGPSRT
ncbi:hypothetical protein P154DRAFT_522972 [Amniculicola lignicola CBS 123094]|uniref:Uncharacterized protein n=1 Tax=Amniculicola lignicola CBS 123094 TaxID=1392246 RepID=A0A6A5WDD1_9PLEO|nr:hypothetical protein P154DRAFT_522972 [Amniculicola lignicola CBS 123094]